MDTTTYLKLHVSGAMQDKSYCKQTEHLGLPVKITYFSHSCASTETRIVTFIIYKVMKYRELLMK